MTAQILKINRGASALHCSGCGAIADAACDCGLPYVPARERAAEAVAANPEKSNRAIADEIGVSYQTVRRAREEATDTGVSVDRRLGRDGKIRRLPVRSVEREEIDEKETPERRRAAFLIFSNEAMLLAHYEGPVDHDVLEAARTTARAWANLVERLEKGN